MPRVRGASTKDQDMKTEGTGGAESLWPCCKIFCSPDMPLLHLALLTPLLEALAGLNLQELELPFNYS